jgi:ribonuclease HI
MTYKNKVVIYTDGACKGNPGVGGWGAILICNNKSKEIFGYEKNTTNNRMEMLAVISALQALNKPCEVQIFTDSKYVQQGMLSWMSNWKNNNWKNSQKQDVKNIDLWKALDLEASKHIIDWKWVKGHSGDKYNEIADALANKGIENGIN